MIDRGKQQNREVKLLLALLDFGGNGSLLAVESKAFQAIKTNIFCTFIVEIWKFLWVLLEVERTRK